MENKWKKLQIVDYLKNYGTNWKSYQKMFIKIIFTYDHQTSAKSGYKKKNEELIPFNSSPTSNRYFHGEDTYQQFAFC